MSLREAFTGFHIIETNENYSRADGPLIDRPKKRIRISFGHPEEHFGALDDVFWSFIIDNPGRAWRVEFHFRKVAISEWVARVPALFWTPESRLFRKLAETKVAYTSRGWRVYEPAGKSEKVMGGIGTFRLSPDRDGTRLVTLTTSCNASAGVPALVHPDVWDKINRGGGSIEGHLLDGKARWQPMDQGWSKRFKSTRGIPRGYLVLKNPDKIHLSKHQEGAPIQIHPFTIMAYRSGSRELFDFVYATGDTGDPNYRGYLADFFEHYQNEEERYGRYLLAGDMVSPLWDAEFDSPADLRHADPTAEPQLKLLEARVRERMFGGNKIEILLEALATNCQSAEDLWRLSDEISIPHSVWYRGGSLAQECSQFVHEVVNRDKVIELVEMFAIYYPNTISG